MTDDTSAAVERLRLYIEYDGGALPLADAHAILAHIADLEARAEQAEADVRTVQNAAKTLDAARQKIIGHYTRERQIDHVARTTLDSEREANAILTERVEALEARAKEAEAKVAAAEDRGLVFNVLPDGRLDFCAIREGSRLWDSRVRADALAAQVAGLREALAWLLNCHRGLNRHGHGVGGDGYWGNIDAATAFAREALDAALQPTSKGDE